MIASSESDPLDNTSWPDPLSKDFGSFNTTLPKQIFIPDDKFFKKPYLVTAIIYSDVALDKVLTSQIYAEYDDVILNINNVPHISQIFSFETIFFPAKADLITFLKPDVTQKASK
jgi:hypothetical protein